MRAVSLPTTAVLTGLLFAQRIVQPTGVKKYSLYQDPAGTPVNVKRPAAPVVNACVRTGHVVGLTSTARTPCRPAVVPAAAFTT